jgi:hypothetical protein
VDFSNAALLITIVYGVTELVKSLLPAKWQSTSQIVVAITLIVGIGVTFLLASTVWAGQTIVGGFRLDDLGTGDKFLVGLLVGGGGAAFLNRGVRAIMNIGQNQPKETVHQIESLVEPLNQIQVQIPADDVPPQVH